MNFLACLAVFTVAPVDPLLDALHRLEGSWVLTIDLPDQTEPVYLRYRRTPDGVISTGTAYPLGKPPVPVETRFRVRGDEAEVKDRQGENTMTATAVFEGGALVTKYNGAPVRDELRWQTKDFATGKVIAGDRIMATYGLRRVLTPEPVLIYGGLDPVALSEGKSVLGEAGRVVSHGGYRYQFASEDSKAKFLSDVAKYRVQFGGACMNMGPLSGRGRPDLHRTFEGKTYLFASETCRDRFNAAPEDFIDQPDPRLNPTASQAKKGKELLEKMADAHGGEALDAMNSLVWWVNTPFESDGKEKPNITAFGYDIKGRYADLQTWDDQAFRSIALPRGGWFGRADILSPIDSDERGYLVRRAMRHPIWLLRLRNSSGFQALYEGQHELGEAVTVHAQGATTTLFADGNGKIAAIQHFGRGQTKKLLSTRTYTDWRTSKGVLLPVAWKTSTPGRPDTLGKADRILVNEGTDLLFEVPSQ